MKAFLKTTIFGALALADLAGVLPASAQTAATPAPQPAAVAPAANVLPWVAEVVKMADAGVAPEVQEAYVKNSPSYSALSVDDILYLKSHGVNDRVIAAMIMHGADVRQAAMAATTPAAQYPPVQYPAPTPVYTPAQPDYQVPAQYPDNSAYYYGQQYPAYDYGYNPYAYGYGYSSWPLFVGGFSFYSRPFYSFGSRFGRPGFGGRPGIGGGVGGHTLGVTHGGFSGGGRTGGGIGRR